MWFMITIVGAGLGAVFLLLLAVRFVPALWEGDLPPAANALNQLIRTLFSFVLALSIVSAWTSLNSARDNAVDEAVALHGVYFAAHGMPEPAHSRIQDLTEDYTKSVIAVDWPLMAQGRIGDETFDKLIALRDEIQRLEPANAKEAALQKEATDRAREVSEARRKRSAKLSDEIPVFLWIGLILCGALVVLIPVLEYRKVTGGAVAMVFLLGAVVTAPLVLVSELNHPYSGISVAPDSFVLQLERFARIS
ncbi:DUF4239 domain-containing protein [Allokutzneria sp. A3M-2-11 16]|uniref:bestrophin-like domain n=1 Tax=Allokutzneria sp. A3M-2-11 16 TaxID=2962043 RepID=UPI0020B71CA5|nr:DUF4239 domain-containing protein [Allokutzneria sp. A3M-2-11 16]MCP3803713.1 DUF4239 domain-containing protein [Allokutzneria sp. A3M-2-11 16]